MTEVFEQAERLAETILDSDEYIAMRLSEEKAKNDTVALDLIATYNQKRQGLERLLNQEKMDRDAFDALGRELRECEHAMDNNETLQRLQSTNEAFSAMMKKVNQIIRFVVTGEYEEETSGGCGGCGGCGGSGGGCGGCPSKSSGCGGCA